MKTFTQVAKNAKDLLGYTYNSTTGKFMNSEGDSLPAKEAVKVNEALDKNVQDHVNHERKVAELKRFGIEEGKEKVSGYPKFQNLLPKKMSKQDEYNTYFNKKSDKYYNRKKPKVDVDVENISKGISNYMALTKREKPIKRPEFLNKKYRDPDMDKGIVALYGGYPKKYI